MKRVSSVLLVIIINIALIGLLSPPGAQAAPMPPVSQISPRFEGLPGVVVFDRVNVRRAPRVTSSAIGRLSLGERITLLGRTLSGAWVFAATRFGNGWINRSFIRFDGTVRDLPVSDVFPPFVMVTAVPSVNVRLGPGELYPIITRLVAGVEVDVLATFSRASWFQIAMPGFGLVGWVRSDTVVFDGNPASVPELPRQPVLATVSSYRVKVHSDAKLNAPTIGVIGLGQYFTVVGVDARGNWWQISGPFGTGWVLSQFVKVYGDWNGLPVYQTEPLR
jgi:uncharacterized protein YraI